MIQKLRQDFRLDLLLSIAQLPRATYYYHIKRQTAPDKYESEKELISAIYHEHRGRYGYRRITDELRDKGSVLNHKTVQRLMRDLKLICRVRMKKYHSYKGEIGKIVPNLLERKFEAEKPNQNDMLPLRVTEKEKNTVEHGGSIVMKEKQKIEVEEKFRIIEAYHRGEINITEAVEKSCVDRETVRGWVRNYEVKGVDTSLPHKNRVYSSELKQQAVEEFPVRRQEFGKHLQKIWDQEQVHFAFLAKGVYWSWRLQLCKSIRRRKPHEAGMKHHTGRTYSDCQRVHCHRKKLWRDRIEVSGQLPADADMTLRFEEQGEADLEDRRGKRKKDQKLGSEIEKAQIEIERLQHKLYLAEMDHDLLKKLDEIERRDAYRR